VVEPSRTAERPAPPPEGRTAGSLWEEVHRFSQPHLSGAAIVLALLAGVPLVGMAVAATHGRFHPVLGLYLLPLLGDVVARRRPSIARLAWGATAVLVGVGAGAAVVAGMPLAGIAWLVGSGISFAIAVRAMTSYAQSERLRAAVVAAVPLQLLLLLLAWSVTSRTL
jgi:hypothetical protein